MDSYFEGLQCKQKCHEVHELCNPGNVEYNALRMGDQHMYRCKI